MTTKNEQMLERLDSILEQLETLGINTQAPAVPVQHLDSYGNPSLVAPGELIESAWGNSVATRVVARFPDQDALNTWSAPRGTLAVTTDQNIYYIRSDTTWTATALGRYPTFRLIGGGVGQALPAAGVATRCTWNTEVSDPFGVVNLGDFTVPQPFAGRWTFEWSVVVNPGDTGYTVAYLQVGTDRYGLSKMPLVAAAGSTVHQGAVSLVMTPGQTASVWAYTSGVATTMNTATDQYFHGYFQGPI